MEVPADGVERLLHFVDERSKQLGLSRQDIKSRGGPEPSTLHKTRDRRSAAPRVSTLLRLDDALGWERGCSAVVLLGAKPLTITARNWLTRREQAGATPMSPQEITDALLGQLGVGIDSARAAAAKLRERIDQLAAMHDVLVSEFTPDVDRAARGA